MIDTIFLSYTGLLHTIVNKENRKIPFNKDLLKSGLYLFGCAREHVFRDVKKDPGELEYISNDIFKYNSYVGAHFDIVDSISLAEKQDRVFWTNVPNLNSSMNKVMDIKKFLELRGISFAKEDEEGYFNHGQSRIHNYPMWTDLLGPKGVRCIW